MVSDKGFTLMELIIGVVVIGILATVAVFSMLLYSKKANYTMALSDCKKVYNAFIDYYTENDMFPYTSSSPAFQLNSFSPLNYQGNIFSKLVNNQADAYDSPDDKGTNQEFWLRMTLAADTNVQFLLAYSDNADIAPGEWLEGVYVFRFCVKTSP